MASPEHLELLKQGVETWNAWMIEHLLIKPDLEDADLNGMNLRNIDLSKANLRGVNLFRACLSQANLRWADFSGAMLHETDLTRSILQWANFNLIAFKHLLRILKNEPSCIDV